MLLKLRFDFGQDIAVCHFNVWFCDLLLLHRSSLRQFAQLFDRAGSSSLIRMIIDFKFNLLNTQLVTHHDLIISMPQSNQNPLGNKFLRPVRELLNLNWLELKVNLHFILGLNQHKLCVKTPQIGVELKIFDVGVFGQF